MSLRHIIIAILVAAIWGFNFIAVKAGLDEMPPYLYGAGRFFIAVLPILFIKKPAVSWSMIIAVGLTLGVFKFTLMFLGIYYGMAAGLASLVLQSQVFFTLLFSCLFFKSKIQLNQVVGMMIAVAGIALIAWNMQAESSMLGFFLIIAAAMSWGIANILYRKVGNVDMFALTVWSSLIPPIPMLCVSLYCDGFEVVRNSLLTMSGLGWLCLAYTACLSSWAGATLWATLIRTYEPHKVAPFSLLVPVFGITFASLFLGENFTMTTVIASILIFSGLVVNQWRGRRVVHEPVVETEMPPVAGEYKKAA